MKHSSYISAFPSFISSARILLVVTLVFLFCLCCEVKAGRSDKAGGAAASELLIPVGAASIGMGGSNLAFVSGVDALYWNPAGMARTHFRYDMMFSHMNYFADIGVEYFAGIIQIENLGAFGLGAKVLSIGDIPITTSDQPDGTGETTSPSFVILSSAYSRMITDKISFGLSANYVVETMEQVSATGIAFTAGLQYEGLGGVQGLNLGVTVRNIGSTMKFDGDGLVYTGKLDDMLRPDSPYKIESSSDALPSTIEIGLGYQLHFNEDAVTSWSVMFQNNNFSADEYKSGVELLFQNSFLIRGGYVYSVLEENQEFIFGPTLGLGIKTVIEDIDFQFDYSYRSLIYFSNNHTISIRIGGE